MTDTPTWLEHAVKIYDDDSHADGDVLSHDWIKYALEISEPRNMEEAKRTQWTLLHRVETFKDWLLVERSTALQTVRGKGYLIVPPKDQARFAAEEAMGMVRKGLDKGARIIEYARLSEMDDDARRRHTDTGIRLCGIRDMMKRQKRDVFKLFAPS
jgi:hypothetical protein